jgi:hypothetical protein
VLPAFGRVAGREAWARLADRIGGRFLVDVLDELRRSPASSFGNGSSPLAESEIAAP